MAKVRVHHFMNPLGILMVLSLAVVGLGTIVAVSSTQQTTQTQSEARRLGDPMIVEITDSHSIIQLGNSCKLTVLFGIRNTTAQRQRLTYQIELYAVTPGQSNPQPLDVRRFDGIWIEPSATKRIGNTFTKYIRKGFNYYGKARFLMDGRGVYETRVFEVKNCRLLIT